MFRTDLTPKQKDELERALLIVRIADELRAENNGFCMGSEAKARSTLKKYSVLDSPLCGKNMGNDLLVIPCDLADNHDGPCERNVWPVNASEQPGELQPLDVDDCGLVFTDKERRVIAEISVKQETRPASVIKRALATYQLLANGTHELREISPSLKLPSDEFLASLKDRD